MTTTSHRDARFPNRIPKLSTANMSSNIVFLAIRAAQLIFGIILLGLTAYGMSNMMEDIINPI